MVIIDPYSCLQLSGALHGPDRSTDSPGFFAKNSANNFDLIDRCSPASLTNYRARRVKNPFAKLSYSTADDHAIRAQ